MCLGMSPRAGNGKGIKVLVCGAGGFIGAHLGVRLKKDGYTVIAADWKRQEYFEEPEFCGVFASLSDRINIPYFCSSGPEFCRL